jgi:hypothetical protein
VDLEIVNSNIYTMETLEMGDKGVILGSDIYAIRGVKAGSIGKKIGKTTVIHCGIDFTAQQEKEKANSQLRLISAKLGKLREILALPPAPGDDPEKRSKIEDLFHRLEEEQKQAGIKIADLMGKLNNDENAVVEITGEISSGTLIEICQVALFVSDPLRKVRIRLDKENNRLIAENL